MSLEDDMKRLAAVLRWHVSRTGLVMPGRAGSREAVLAVVSRGTESCIETWRLMLESPMAITMDSFVWWDDDDAISLRVVPEQLVDSLTRQNLLLEAGSGCDTQRSRRILEDMVFLQFFPEDKGFERLWADAGARSFDSSKLVLHKPARWIDFTMQARRAASTVYGNLLKGAARGRTGHDIQ